jgi:aerobic-type carbon monoxide dehydrogenase small subunit (CoxS/CutS family)
MSERKIRLKVNGKALEGTAEPRRSLAEFLREDLGLTGTHIGCEQGVCGACTIVMNGAAVRSCLMFAVQAEGAELQTVEGLAQGERLHPLQQAFHEAHALQCGFCTPGFLMSLSAFLKETPDPSDEQIREAMSGNLCRCTGYVSIHEAVRAAAKMLRTKS